MQFLPWIALVLFFKSGVSELANATVCKTDVARCDPGTPLHFPPAGSPCGRSIKVNVPGREPGEEGALPSGHPPRCREQDSSRSAPLLPVLSGECSVAQRAERRFHKPQVVRASRTGATVFLVHRVIRPTAKDAALPTRRRRGSTGMAHVFYPLRSPTAPSRDSESRQCGCESCRRDPLVVRKRRWCNRQHTGLRNPQVRVRFLNSAARPVFYSSGRTVRRAETNSTG